MTTAMRSSVRQAMREIPVVSIASATLNAGRIVIKRLASIYRLEPGAPSWKRR
jgi:hypothetical protein